MDLALIADRVEYNAEYASLHSFLAPLLSQSDEQLQNAVGHARHIQMAQFVLYARNAVALRDVAQAQPAAFQKLVDAIHRAKEKPA